MQKYKVFFNEKCIRIGTHSNITFSKPLPEYFETCNSEGIRSWLVAFLKDDSKETVLEHESPEEVLEAIQKAVLFVEAAGGVVVRNGMLLFIYRNGIWDLPKGKIDQGEQAREAAIREVEEECGISGHQIVKKLPSCYHLYISPYKKSKGELILKETFWYEMSYAGNEDGVPQLEEGITKIGWFAKNDLDEVYNNTYENLKPIIDLYRC